MGLQRASSMTTGSDARPPAAAWDPLGGSAGNLESGKEGLERVSTVALRTRWGADRGGAYL